MVWQVPQMRAFCVYVSCTGMMSRAFFIGIVTGVLERSVELVGVV